MKRDESKNKKFYSIFFKKLRFPKAEPLVARRNERKSRVELVQLLSSGAFEEVWNPFAREKGSKNRFRVESNLKNYPVDDF